MLMLKKVIYKILQFIYRYGIKKISPTIGYVTYNELKVKPIKAGDRYVPPKWRNYKEAVKPNYESALINGLRNYVKTGDHIVIVGGGYGVTSCIASKLTGKEGKVTCYEASQTSIKHIKRTLSLNDCFDNISLHNKSVGRPISIMGSAKANMQVEPEELPECDILELDCEGSEKEILQNLKIRPKVILVETHGIFNSPTTEIVELLKKINYKTVSVEIAEIDLAHICNKRDIKVITAHLAE